MAEYMSRKRRKRRRQDEPEIMSNEDMLFTRLYDKLALNLEAPELIQNLFSKNVITHIELKKIHEQKLPYKKTKKLLKILRHKQNFIPTFVDAVKTIPGLQYIAEWIEKEYKEILECGHVPPICPCTPEPSHLFNVAEAFAISVLHLSKKDTNIRVFQNEANEFANKKNYDISISAKYPSADSGKYSSPDPEMTVCTFFEVISSVNSRILKELVNEFEHLLKGLIAIFEKNQEGFKKMQEYLKKPSLLPVDHEQIEHIATVEDFFLYLNSVKNHPYFFIDTQLLTEAVDVSMDDNAKLKLDTSLKTIMKKYSESMDLCLEPADTCTYKPSKTHGLVPVTVTCSDHTVSWNGVKQKKEAICCSFGLPLLALRFTGLSRGSIVIVWEMSVMLADIVCTVPIAPGGLELLSMFRITQVKIGNRRTINVPPLYTLQKDGKTALALAAMYGNKDVVKFLMPEMCNAVDKDKKTALDLAVEHERVNIIELLVNAGGLQGDDVMSKVQLLFDSCKTRDIVNVKEAVSSMIELDTKNEDGETALFLAVRSADFHTSAFLVEEGACVNILNKQGKSLLEVAVEKRLWDIVSMLRNYGAMDADEIAEKFFSASRLGDIVIVERMLQMGLNTDMKNKDGETALMLSAMQDHHNIIDLLLFFNTDIGMINKKLKSALDIATKHNSRRSREILVKCNAPSGDVVCQQLHTSSKSGEIAALKRAIARGVPVDYRSATGGTSIMMASLKNHLSVVQTLIDSGASVNAQDQDGFTALMAATANNHCTVVQWLLKSGGDPNLKSMTGCSALYLASENGYVEVVKALMRGGADVNIQDKDGTTPLSIACQMQRSDVVRILLEGQAKASVDVTKNDGSTALFPAVHCGNHEIIRTLIKGGANVNFMARRGFTVLFIASEHGDLQAVRALIDAKADVNIKTKEEDATCIYLASQNGHMEVVTALLEAGADVNSQLKNGVTPLFIASQIGNRMIVKALIEAKCDVNLQTKSGATSLYVASGRGYSDIVQLLLSAKASINLQVEDGAAALHIACNGGYAEVVKCLLNNGANGNLQTKSGATALHIATQRNEPNIVSILLEAHVDVNLAREDGDTALHIASENGFKTILEQLIMGGANVNIQMKEEYTPLHLACQNGFSEVVHILIQNAAVVNCKNEEECTPLHLACQNGFIEVVQILIENAAVVNCQNEKGLTAVMLSVIFKHTPILEELLHSKTKPKLDIITMDGWSALMFAANMGNLDATKALIGAGAPVNQRNEDGLTALTHAVLQNHTEITRCLLDATKADINVQLKPGWTPLMIATANCNVELVKLFIKKGADVNVVDKNGCRAIDLTQNQEILKILRVEKHDDTSDTYKNPSISQQGITDQAARYHHQRTLPGSKTKKCKEFEVRRQNAKYLVEYTKA